MYPTRIICRPRTGSRVTKHAAPACNRAIASGFFPAPFIGSARHGLNPFAGGSPFNDFAPLIRFLDDSARTFENFPISVSRSQPRAQQEVFQPRFDVREIDGAYELRGELPGVESKNLDVEFTDANTLVIRGHTESEHTSGTSPEAIQAESENKNVDNANVETSDAASVHSNDSTSSYVQPTVEDEVTPESNNTTSAIDAAPTDQSKVSAPAKAQAEQPAQATSHYWVNERSTGTFQRTFAFPARVNHDGVTASLRNGILVVTVPKAAEPAARKISVQ